MLMDGSRRISCTKKSTSCSEIPPGHKGFSTKTMGTTDTAGGTAVAAEARQDNRPLKNVTHVRSAWDSLILLIDDKRQRLARESVMNVCWNEVWLDF